MANKNRNIKRIIKKKIDFQKNMGKQHPKIVLNTTSKQTSPNKPMKTRKPIEITNLNKKERFNLRSGVLENKDIIIPREKKKPVSIIITAYETENYIEECLDSIVSQNYFINYNEYEILVGVDACINTLNRLMNIKHKYSNLKIFMMKENVGTYVVSNTLLDLVTYENIIRFDSDDIMLYNMISEIMFYVNEYDLIKFSYYNVFNNGKVMLKNNGNKFAAGAIFYKKNIFNIYGGYEAWLCAAEGDLLARIGDDLLIKGIEKGLFNRRVRNNSLTQDTKTGMKSELRKHYHELTRQNVENKVKFINKVTSEYYYVE